MKTENSDRPATIVRHFRRKKRVIIQNVVENILMTCANKNGTNQTSETRLIRMIAMLETYVGGRVGGRQRFR